MGEALLPDDSSRRRRSRGKGSASRSVPPSPPPDPYKAALRLLSQREYSSRGLRRVLERKFPGDERLASVIRRLKEKHFLDDRRFAEHSASSLLRHRGFGPHRIRRELRAKHVPSDLISPVLDQVFEEVDERELVERALEKKLRSLRGPLTRRRLDSLYRSLVRQGFSTGVIISTVRAHRELDGVELSVPDAESEAEP